MSLRKWLDDESTKSDQCIDCDAPIQVPTSRPSGISRCPTDDAIAMNIAQPRPKKRED